MKEGRKEGRKEGKAGRKRHASREKGRQETIILTKNRRGQKELVADANITKYLGVVCLQISSGKI